MSAADRELAATVRTEGARILATLVRTVGSLTVAEDAVQEAAVRALRDWPRTGVPDQPRAWLTVVARRVAVDLLRRENQRAGKERDGMDLIALSGPDEPPESVVRDDRLRLIFTCCHPALALDAQVTLALRVLCGLSPAQIAAVLLSTEAAIAKRLTRTRGKIAKAGIPYRVPQDHELPARLAAVCAVLHAAYTAAHASGGDTVSDVDGCAEAVRLARLVHRLMPDEPMPMAVLALVLLTEARRQSRVDGAGEPVLLADQDRTCWHRPWIDEGTALLAESLRRTAAVADPYQLHAAIAAEHARAPSYPDTDWPEIERLYDLLLSVQPTDSARLARAVAVAEARGAEAGLLALQGLQQSGRWHAVRATLLARTERYADAVAAMRASLDDAAEVVSAPELRLRRRQLTDWQAVVTG